MSKYYFTQTKSFRGKRFQAETNKIIKQSQYLLLITCRVSAKEDYQKVKRVFAQS